MILSGFRREMRQSKGASKEMLGINFGKELINIGILGECDYLTTHI